MRIGVGDEQGCAAGGKANFSTGRLRSPIIATVEQADVTRAERVDLAHEADFRLGRLTVLPSRRELARDDGMREVLEHRVMQVLIALARAGGSVVTRDELTRRCWDGRVVGEDAINRVISRLRKSADGIGGGTFRIETVTKIGYRLVGSGAGEAAERLPGTRDGPEAGASTGKTWLSRRSLLAAAALAATGLAGGVLAYRSREGSAASPEIESLMSRAFDQLGQGTPEGQTQAIGLLRRVVNLAPEYAEGWGALGVAYGNRARYRALADSDALRERARLAADRALELDPDSSLAQVARVFATPLRGNWLAAERGLRTALAGRNRNGPLHAFLGGLLMNVGRCAEALTEYRASEIDPLPPGKYFDLIAALWSTGALEEADRRIAEAAELYPTQFGLWFQRFYIRMYSGEVAAAIAQASDREGMPTGIPVAEFDRIVEAARAIETRAPADIERVMTRNMADAHEGNGYAENAMQFACALGRVDEAFAIADAYYFSRGFVVPDLRFTQSQGAYKPVRERDTYFLFWPSLAPMRADRRFDRLAEELGLARYWREAGVQPDYRRA